MNSIAFSMGKMELQRKGVDSGNHGEGENGGCHQFAYHGGSLRFITLHLNSSVRPVPTLTSLGAASATSGSFSTLH